MEQDRFMCGWKKMQEIDGGAGKDAKTILRRPVPEGRTEMALAALHVENASLNWQTVRPFWEGRFSSLVTGLWIDDHDKRSKCIYPWQLCGNRICYDSCLH